MVSFLTTDDPAEAFDSGPSSEIRPVAAHRVLVVSTGLRGPAADASCVTVTDDAGAVYYEGPPSADGCIALSFDGSPDVMAVRVLLETPRAHRQARVGLSEGRTEYSFAG
jgi:hypothetical protein